MSAIELEELSVVLEEAAKKRTAGSACELVVADEPVVEARTS
jgi:hypothetical protein